MTLEEHLLLCIKAAVAMHHALQVPLTDEQRATLAVTAGKLANILTEVVNGTNAILDILNSLPLTETDHAHD